MSDEPDTLPRLWQAACALLGACPREVTLATMGREGPQARVVMLRGAEMGARVESEEGGCLPPAAGGGPPEDLFGAKTGGPRAWVFTDAQTAKVEEIEGDPRVALLLWDRTSALQLRIAGRATVSLGVPEDVWAGMEEAQRRNYGKVPAPGTVIEEALAYEERPSAAEFARIDVALTELEVLHLGRVHRRARFSEAAPQGEWLVP
ncbi:pyridoxamine 5'-phosphate oxidase family protein [Pseudoroseicyclus sp. H15]